MTQAQKPHAPSCERNREPILAVLREHLADRHHLLEIGSGTGQHAVYFAKALTHLNWQATDRAENLAGIALWLDEAALPNTPKPLEFEVNTGWPQSDRAMQRFDAAFSANTLHIMSWPEVERLFAQLDDLLTDTAKLIVYGPFNYAGQFTSPSNADFDVWLKARGEHQGIRDFEAVTILAASIGLQLVEDREMPANNRCLIWQRRKPSR